MVTLIDVISTEHTIVTLIDVISTEHTIVTLIDVNSTEHTMVTLTDVNSTECTMVTLIYITQHLCSSPDSATFDLLSLWGRGRLFHSLAACLCVSLHWRWFRHAAYLWVPACIWVGSFVRFQSTVVSDDVSSTAQAEWARQRGVSAGVGEQRQLGNARSCCNTQCHLSFLLRDHFSIQPF